MLAKNHYKYKVGQALSPASFSTLPVLPYSRDHLRFAGHDAVLGLADIHVLDFERAAQDAIERVARLDVLAAGVHFGDSADGGVTLHQHHIEDTRRTQLVLAPFTG